MIGKSFIGLCFRTATDAPPEKDPSLNCSFCSGMTGSCLDPFARLEVTSEMGRGLSDKTHRCPVSASKIDLSFGAGAAMTA